jgi:predicted nucleic acid-binding protein
MPPTTIYVDTSAIAKLFIAETETGDLQRWLTSQSEPRLVSSALLAVELLRLMRLVDQAAVGSAERFLIDDVDIVDILPPVLADAAVVEPVRLRTLDAIHLATARDLGPTVDVVLTYDRLLAEAARSAGLVVAAPGQA